MLEGRWGHANFAHEGDIYTFGGNGTKKTAEILKNDVRAYIPEMPTGLSWLSVVEYGGQLILAGFGSPYLV